MKRALVLIALGALGGAANAAQIEGKPVAAPQAPLGRLFFTPTERSQLDVARLQRKPTPQSPAEPEQVEAPPAPQVVSYGGIVRRSDGKAMLWINNRLVEEKDALKGLSLKGKVRPDGAVTLQVPQTGGSIDVKVGQSVELQTGRIGETRKPPPEAKAPPPEETKPGQADAPPAAAGAPPAPASSTAAAGAPAVRPAPEIAEKKPAPGPGVGLRMDLGTRALDPAESKRLSGAAK